MAVRRTTTRRRRTTRTTTGGGAAASVVNSLNELVKENSDLRKEVENLKSTLARIGGLLGGAVTAVAGTARRGRRAATAGAAPRGRRRTAAAASSTATATRTRRTRKPITDPVALQRRRDALAKARAVRAQKIAAAKK